LIKGGFFSKTAFLNSLFIDGGELRWSASSIIKTAFKEKEGEIS
jgi:hypothetical protein